MIPLRALAPSFGRLLSEHAIRNASGVQVAAVRFYSQPALGRMACALADWSDIYGRWQLGWGPYETAAMAGLSVGETKIRADGRTWTIQLVAAQFIVDRIV